MLDHSFVRFLSERQNFSRIWRAARTHSGMKLPQNDSTNTADYLLMHHTTDLVLSTHTGVALSHRSTGAYRKNPSVFRRTRVPTFGRVGWRVRCRSVSDAGNASTASACEWGYRCSCVCSARTLQDVC